MFFRTLFGLSLLLFVGCAAAYTPPPLTTAHPAHPEATAAPPLPPSTALAYRPSDIPAPQPANHMTQREMPAGMPHAMHDGPTSQQESQQRFEGEGKVIAVVPSSDQLVVDHGPIKGLMDAMTMGYRVASPVLLEGLNPGDEVRFTIDAQKKVIVKIERLKP